MALFIPLQPPTNIPATKSQLSQKKCQCDEPMNEYSAGLKPCKLQHASDKGVTPLTSSTSRLFSFKGPDSSGKEMLFACGSDSVRLDSCLHRPGVGNFLSSSLGKVFTSLELLAGNGGRPGPSFSGSSRV